MSPAGVKHKMSAPSTERSPPAGGRVSLLPRGAAADYISRCRGGSERIPPAQPALPACSRPIPGMESRGSADTMSLAYEILYTQKCRSTHHKLAMDALPLLRSPEKARWLDLFTYYIDWYLEGAKAPDDKFKDFKNHVLHVRENFWGGACTTARTWYRKSLELFRRRDWPAAVYSAGVLSHYFTDPFEPFHTGQTEAEGVVHRAQEWSICKAYAELKRLIEYSGGYPEVAVPDQDDWLEEMIRRGALAGNEHYEVCIDHYNIDLGVKNPPAGLDDEIRERISKQIGLATAGWARVLDKLIVESCASADEVPVLLTVGLSTAQQPLQASKDFVNNRAERIRVGEMYEEFKATGKVVNTLPEDDREVRKLHAAEVLECPLFLLNAEKVRPPGSKHGTFEAKPKKPLAAKTPRKYTIDGRPIAENSSALSTPSMPAPVRRYDPPAPQLTPSLPPPLATSSVRSEPPLIMSGAKSVSVKAPTPPVVVEKPVAEKPKPVTPPPLPQPKAELDDRGTITAPMPPARDPLADLPKPGAVPLPPRTEASRVAPLLEKPKEPAKTPEPPKNDEPKAAAVAPKPELPKVEPPKPVVPPPQPAVATAPAVAPPKPSGNLKFYLDLDDDLEAAPSIGPKTAKKFEALGIKTVRDFLKQDASAIAGKLNAKHVTIAIIKDWQDQTRLAAAVPNLRGHDAQILVGCGLREPKEVATASVGDLDTFVQEFVATSEGQRALRGSEKPDAKEIADWIAWAKQARTLAL